MSIKSLKIPRKMPQQTRSKVLVDAILSATAHIIEKFGPEEVTTNKVAELAGVSIGSLYQYFPNKEALIGKLIEKYAFHHVEILERTIQNNSELSIDEIISILVKSVLIDIIENQRLFRFVVSNTFSVDRLETLILARRKMINLITSILLSPQYKLNFSQSEAHLMSYTIVASLGGIVESIIFDNSSSRDFQNNLLNECITLIQSYVHQS